MSFHDGLIYRGIVIYCSPRSKFLHRKLIWNHDTIFGLVCSPQQHQGFDCWSILLHAQQTAFPAPTSSAPRICDWKRIEKLNCTAYIILISTKRKPLCGTRVVEAGWWRPPALFSPYSTNMNASHTAAAGQLEKGEIASKQTLGRLVWKFVIENRRVASEIVQSGNGIASMRKQLLWRYHRSRVEN